MVEHRRTVSRRGSVLPGWFFLLTALVTVVGTGGLGYVAWQSWDRPGETIAAPSPEPSSPSPTPSPTEATVSPSPSPSASPSPSPTPSPTPEATRDLAVSVLNATRTPGLAAQAAARVTQAGWSVAVVGNWRGAVAATTVYHPPGAEAQAELLASDLGLDAVLPAVQGMSTDRLTVLVLSVP